MCGITPEYFRKIFRTYYGTSPVKYINELKLSHAKELLSSGMYSVTDAALQSGYSDMSFFSREFKKNTDVTPKDYRMFNKKSPSI
ncbi:MAG: helix-turn-helix transcriptional regulator [Firmicutes bacterium]|nr:helix-turn-helix transcriptional regulator [Bacillota bacterium]